MAKGQNNYQPRLLIKYNEVVQKYLADQLDIKNYMRIPKIKKIVLNMGIGDAKEHKNWLRQNLSHKSNLRKLMVLKDVLGEPRSLKPYAGDYFQS